MTSDHHSYRIDPGSIDSAIGWPEAQGDDHLHVTGEITGTEAEYGLSPVRFHVSKVVMR